MKRILEYIEEEIDWIDQVEIMDYPYEGITEWAPHGVYVQESLSRNLLGRKTRTKELRVYLEGVFSETKRALADKIIEMSKPSVVEYIKLYLGHSSKGLTLAFQVRLTDLEIEEEENEIRYNLPLAVREKIGSDQVTLPRRIGGESHGNSKRKDRGSREERVQKKSDRRAVVRDRDSKKGDKSDS